MGIGAVLALVASLALGCATTPDTTAPGTTPTDEGPVSDTATTDQPRTAEPDVSAVGDELCRLAALAREDPTQAAAAFDHGPLHPIAADLAETDREAAGRLLEAKAAAEAAVRQEELDASELSTVLAELAGRLPDHTGCEQ